MGPLSFDSTVWTWPGNRPEPQTLAVEFCFLMRTILIIELVFIVLAASGASSAVADGRSAATNLIAAAPPRPSAGAVQASTINDLLQAYERLRGKTVLRSTILSGRSSLLASELPADTTNAVA